MEKLTAVIFSIFIALGMTSCTAGNQTDETAITTPSAQQTSAAAENSDETSAENETSSGEGKTLVVYYSATNNTEAVAGYIASATGGELYELVPTEPYTSDDLDWTDRNSRVSKEHDDESLRNVELENPVPDNWEDYDTVFIGYPIWWGIAAWPVNNFVTSNDFTGKTVIPFCTSSSSGIGESGTLLEEAAGTGSWLDGERFRSGQDEETVTEWVNSLNLN